MEAPVPTKVKPEPNSGGRSIVWKHFSSSYKATTGKHKDRMAVQCLVPKGSGNEWSCVWHCTARAFTAKNGST